MMDLLQLVIAALLAYLVGVGQGRKQTQHDESVKVVIELRRRALDAIETLSTWPDPEAEDYEEPDCLEFALQIKDLTVYYRANEPWLSAGTVERLTPLIDGLTDLARQAVYRLGVGEGQVEARSKIREIFEEQIRQVGEGEVAEVMREVYDEVYDEVFNKPYDYPTIPQLISERLEPIADELGAESRRLIGTSQPWWGWIVLKLLGKREESSTARRSDS